ncbi:hypothetical protein PanWU01x14_018130 [Parasponia andersonii]|uniref:Uncharacterized protein n=1 Tax=Parasponia andersonii TaxID=3476 RepID=A0A2P5DZ31_PARAD|nr:hypothetical protein PanWU01x14_018130 [Parasponia andersonii]
MAELVVCFLLERLLEFLSGMIKQVEDAKAKLTRGQCFASQNMGKQKPCVGGDTQDSAKLGCRK